MLDFRKSLINSTLSKVLKRLHYPLEVMLTCVRWYVAYPLSLRHVEEMMQERGVFVDHSTVHRWAIKVLPVLAAVFRKRKRPAGSSWRMNETYIKVAGKWKYLYRAVDRAGDTVDFLLTAKRDKAAARRFLERAINLHGVPEKITIDRSGANTAANESVKTDACVDILMRQNKYLNNIVEQDHQARTFPSDGVSLTESSPVVEWRGQRFGEVRFFSSTDPLNSLHHWSIVTPHFPTKSRMLASYRFWPSAWYCVLR